MADQYQDVVHVVDVNREQFASGDGRSRLFPFTANGIDVVPSVIRAVFVGDWQAPFSQMYPFIRTNQLNTSYGFSPARGWEPVQLNPSSIGSELLGPNNARGKVQRMRLGDCVGGPGSDTGGVSTTADVVEGVSYLGTLWVRASNPCTGRLFVGEAGAASAVSIGTTWSRVGVPGAATAGSSQLAFGFYAIQGDNAGVDPDTEIEFTFAQLEQDFDNGAMGRYIETNGAPVSFVDYQVSEGNLLTTDPVANGSPIYWSGNGYWLESPGDANPIVSSDLLSGVTWSFDQSPVLLSLLRAKQEWYRVNHVQFWQGWTDRIFQLKDANTFGTAVWAFILSVPITAVSLRDDTRYFAFGPTRGNFTESEGAPVNPSSGNFPPISQGGQIATPKEKIQALRLKYYALTSDCTIHSINKMLADVFEDEGLAYVKDNEDMTMEYVFTFPVSVGFQQSMLEYALLPKPAGVKITITAP